MKILRFAIPTALVLAASGSLFAQADDPGNASFNPNNGPRGGVGTVVGTVAIPGGTPVGLEHDGGGNLLLTDISDDSYRVIATGGAVQAGPTTLSGGPNPIGITSLGSSLYVTDTVTEAVVVYNTAGAAQSSFSVSGQTTFPEGITSPTYNGNLFVVDGSGGNNVYEYDTAGSLLNTFPINGSSPDGIAFDDRRCVFWIYDSGTDTVRSYDSTFTAVDTFPGGQGGGEGLGVIGDSLYLVITGAGTMAEFDISGATSAANAGTLCPQQVAPPSIPVPTLGSKAMILMVLTLMLGGGLVLLRRAV